MQQQHLVHSIHHYDKHGNKFFEKKSRETYKIRASLMVSIFDNEIIEKSRDEVICFLIPPALLKIVCAYWWCVERKLSRGWKTRYGGYCVVEQSVWAMEVWRETDVDDGGMRKTVILFVVSFLCELFMNSLFFLFFVNCLFFFFSPSLSKTNNNTASFCVFSLFCSPLISIASAYFYSE